MATFVTAGLATITGAVTGLLADVQRRRLSVARLAGWNGLLVLDIAGFAVTAGVAAGLCASTVRLTIADTAMPLLSPVIMSLIAFVLIGRFLWREGLRQVQLQRPAGLVFGEFLILGGTCLALSSWVFPVAVPVLALPRAVAIPIAASLSVTAGGFVIAAVIPPFMRGREEHRVLRRIADQGEFLQSEWIPPTEECAHPERWRMLDPQSAELEVLDLLEAIIKALKPQLIVETGTFIGHSAIRMGRALKSNGFGKIITIEYDPAVFNKAKELIDASGLGRWIEYRQASSLETKIDGQIDLLYSDSDIQIREREVRRFLPQIAPRGLVLIHDSSSHFKVVCEAARRLESEGLLSVLLLSTPRGLCIGQKRDGRT
jgi:predicted O-methyltransferase YrrM